MTASLLVRNIGRLTTWAEPVVSDAALLIRDGRVAWFGPDRESPAGIGDIVELDAAGAGVIPGFVDPHTHVVFAGDRREELTARISGASYSAGGIATTVTATNAATDQALLDATVKRLEAMRRGGTTTVEIKTGYSLTAEGELRMLRIASEAASIVGVRSELTYLGAHVVRPGTDQHSYVNEVIAQLPVVRAAGAKWCDVFCDVGAFTVDQARRILIAARNAGLGLRLHADQLASVGASRLAAELGCASADHLDQIEKADAKGIAEAGVVAVLMPVASLQTRGGADHVRALVQAGATLALATDCNPGTAWCESLPMTVQLACWLWGLDVETALRAATIGGAQSLRRTDIGHLGVGARGDLAILNSAHEGELATHVGTDAVTMTVVGGSTRS